MKKDTVAQGHRGHDYIARIRQRFEGWGTCLRSAANEHILAWQSTLLSRRKLTRPDEVAKMRQPAPPTPRATWYR